MTDGIPCRTDVKAKNPKKKCHQIYDKTIVVIDNSLVTRFGIDENVWVEQEPVEGGIFLHIMRQDIPRKAQ